MKLSEILDRIKAFDASMAEVDMAAIEPLDNDPLEGLMRPDADLEFEEVAWGVAVSDLTRGDGDGWTHLHVGSAESVPGFSDDDEQEGPSVRPQA